MGIGPEARQRPALPPDVPRRFPNIICRDAACFQPTVKQRALTLTSMTEAFEHDLSQSITLLLAMQDDGFAKRFAMLLTSSEVLHVVKASERWECTPQKVARLIVTLRGRGENHLVFLNSHSPADAYVEEEVVLRALHHLGWRIEAMPRERQGDGRPTLSISSERLRAHG